MRSRAALLTVVCVLIGSATGSPPAASFIALQTPACVPPPAGLVAWWPAEGDASDVQSGHDGILQGGVTFVPGVVGQAFEFDGVDDFVAVADEEPFDFATGPFSISAWVRSVGGRGFNEHIVSKGNLWTGGDDYVLWISGTGEGGMGHVKLQYRWPDDQDLLSTSRVDDGNWHHIVVTQSGACPACARLYVDGLLEDTKDGKTLENGTDPFIIGGTYAAGYAWPFFPFKGSIDEVAVFNRALPPEEVLAVFAAGSAGICLTLPGFLPPVSNLPDTNVAKAGSAIPVKWVAGGYQGLDILAPGFPASGAIPCDSTTVASALEETNTAGNSRLSYDARADEYVYVWKTDKTWAGSCRQLVVKLTDGARRRANFRFR